MRKRICALALSVACLLASAGCGHDGIACAGELGEAVAPGDDAIWQGIRSGDATVSLEGLGLDAEGAFQACHEAVSRAPLADPCASYHFDLAVAGDAARRAAPIRAVEGDMAAYEERLSAIAGEASQEDCAMHAAMAALALLTEGGEFREAPYDVESAAYSAMVEGHGCCVAWAEAYADVLARIGVPCKGVTTADGSHMVAVAEIGGVRYAVDVEGALHGEAVPVPVEEYGFALAWD